MRLFALMVSMLLATLISLITFSIAKADTPSLRQFVTVASDVVTIGDLFHDSGVYAEKAIFRAPSLNSSGEVSARLVAQAARRAGLSELDLNGIEHVIVRREAQMVGAEAFSGFLADAIAMQIHAEGPVDVSFNGAVPTLPATAQGNPLQLQTLALSERPGRGAYAFEAHLTIDQGQSNQRLVLRGQATEMADIHTLATDIARGETLSQSDIAIERVPRSRQQDGLTSAQQLVGKVATRPLRAGQILRARDVAVPDVISRNDAVRIVYANGLLTVTAEGRALQSGPIGSVIGVLNRASSRRIDAKIIGPGLVSLNEAPAVGMQQAELRP